MMRIIIVTGLAGAGKSTALRALEDYGFYCIDNLPLPLVEQTVAWLQSEGMSEDLALAIDGRQHPYLGDYKPVTDALEAIGHPLTVLYLDASDDCLLRRFSATRRRHPLSMSDLSEGIAKDRELLTAIRHQAAVIDTTELNVHQLKATIQDRYGKSRARLTVVLLSFGFKHGLPRESNLVFDVRFLRNPYFVPELEPRNGRDPEVAAYVLDNDDARTMLDHIEGLLRFKLPHFESERKLYLTVAVGCTGGRHRSVATVEELARRFKLDWDVIIKHRDLDLRT